MACPLPDHLPPPSRSRPPPPTLSAPASDTHCPQLPTDPEVSYGSDGAKARQLLQHRGLSPEVLGEAKALLTKV